MNSVFVIRNQLGQYWGKKKQWVDGTDPKRILICVHEDECLNIAVELSARDIELRATVGAAELNDRGVPQVEPSAHLIADDPESGTAAGTDDRATSSDNERAAETDELPVP